MTRPRLLIVPVLVLFACGMLAAQAEPAPEVPADRTSLERIASSLEALVSLQRTTLLLQQVALEERRIAPLKNDLRNAKSRVESHNEELERMKSYLQQIDDQISELVRTGTEPDNALRSERTQVEDYLRIEGAQRDAAERRIMELENLIKQRHLELAIRIKNLLTKEQQEKLDELR